VGLSICLLFSAGEQCSNLQFPFLGNNLSYGKTNCSFSCIEKVEEINFLEKGGVPVPLLGCDWHRIGSLFSAGD
jgi:hypothetical protein